MPKITNIDHIVLNVSDMEASLRFYTEVLGLAPQRLQAFRRGEAPFPSVRVNDRFIIDLFSGSDQASTHPPRVENMHHFCLVVEKETFDELPNHLAAHGVAVEEGPLPRWGARGMATSIYFRDPDGNLIEIRSYDERLSSSP